MLTSLITVSILLFILSVTYFFYARPSAITKTRSIAVTIDDVPVEGDTFEKILAHVNYYKIPITVFVIANRLDEEKYAYLDALKGPNFIIGNHTYSHKELQYTPTNEYMTDINYADEILTPLMGPKRYFRYPYLSMGKWFKKRKVKKYLAEKNYVIAPVTVRSRDTGLNNRLMSHPHTETHLMQIKEKYLSSVWKKTLRAERIPRRHMKKQILLVHANTLNSYFLGDLIKMYLDKGYQFISLHDVL